MTDQERKVMEMALEAIELHVGMYPHMDKGFMVDAREALRQALEQQDMGIDRGAWSDVPDATKWVDALRGDEESEQEPEAWTLTEFLDKRETTTNAPLWFVDPVNSAWTPLYTAPPSKQEPSMGLIQSEWSSIENDGMRYPERSDLIGGETDCVDETLNSCMDVMEPVAWMQADQAELYVKEFKDEVRGYTIPLYTAPPNKPWVSLTDDDLAECFVRKGRGLDKNAKFARLIEAKLKEKNT